MFSLEVFSGVAIFVSLFAYLLYVYSIYSGKSKPHVYSWFSWFIVILIGGMAQGHVDDGGSSSVVLYVKAFCYLSIAVWACSLKNKNISRSDTYTFIGALFAIPIWLITKNPLAALCVIMVIDVLSFFPTIRKTYDEPCSENLTAYMLSGSSYIFMMLAVANPTFETLFYPIFLTTLELGFVLFVLIVRALKTSMPQKQGICTADI